MRSVGREGGERELRAQESLKGEKGGERSLFATHSTRKNSTDDNLTMAPEKNAKPGEEEKG